MYRKKCPNHSKELAYGQVRSGGERVNGGGGGGGAAAGSGCGERLRGTAPVSKMVSTGIALFMWSLPLRLTKLRAALILFVKHGCAIFGVLRYSL